MVACTCHTCRSVRRGRHRRRQSHCSPAMRRSASRFRDRSVQSPARPPNPIDAGGRDADACRRRRNRTRSAFPRAACRAGPAEICTFPPLRVEFAQPPAATSLFAGQKRLKLVTHCKVRGGLSAASAARIFGLSDPQPAHPAELPGAAGDRRLCRDQRQGFDDHAGAFSLRIWTTSAKRNGTYRGTGWRPHPRRRSWSQPKRHVSRCSNI